MNLLCKVFVLLLFATEGVNSFSNAFWSSLPAVSYDRVLFRDHNHDGNNSNKPAPLIRRYGILDEISDSDSTSGSSSSSSSSSSQNQEAYERLFEDLIFSTRDSRSVVADQLETCSDPGFVQWLETMMNDSVDDDERSAVQELLDIIVTLKSARAAEEEQASELQRAEEEERRQSFHDDKVEENAPAKMSAADVLKKASEIDQAVMTAEASDDELPDDFMRDAKAVAGLSGFNNRGQMRVGGS